MNEKNIKVCIVGRPNVGKSSVFNCLIGRHKSIVEDISGVTRDRVEHILLVNDRKLVLIDTGGMGFDGDDFALPVEGQIAQGLQEADLLLFIVDVRSGLTQADQEVARTVRKLNKPTILIINKCDTTQLAESADHDFHALGFKNTLAFSAHERYGRKDLLSKIGHYIETQNFEDAPEDDSTMHVALLGKRNSGKSTLLNHIAQEERSIVSDIPGTTRDQVDVLINGYDAPFKIIDTAGLRRKGQYDDVIDFYSFTRSRQALQQCDVACLMLDLSSAPSEVDKKLAQEIISQQKPCLIVGNKLDLLDRDIDREELCDSLWHYFPALHFAPIQLISAKRGTRVPLLIEKLFNLFNQSCEKLSTSQLNKILEAALVKQRPPMKNNRIPKLYYITQTGTQPPTFTVFMNDPNLLNDPWKRYFENQIREESDLTEIPLKVIFKARRRR